MLRVRVPATSANLGPGFDCLGLALGIYLTVEAELGPDDHLVYRGEGEIEDTPDNLIHQGFRTVFEAIGRAAPTVRFGVHNPIPLARGLGSSSAALVAGAALADTVLGGEIGRDGVFELTATLEGHPDNVAPAVYGGFTVSAKGERGYLTRSLPLPPGWRLLFAVPPFELLTQHAREVLPEQYPRSAVIHTASRTALWTLAVLRQEGELLRTASDDVLHEPYREPLVPGLAATRRALLDAGAYAAFLSGAGPTLGVVTSAGSLDVCREILGRFAGRDGRVLQPPPGHGYRFDPRPADTPAG